VFVSDPYEGYPAMKAGIWAGDEIVEVDGRKMAGMDTEEVSKLLKGQAGFPSEGDHPTVGDGTGDA
jgi:carboxyl-terminal processing protease